jgi:drug/metabolite transporter (DMT)-like permease
MGVVGGIAALIAASVALAATVAVQRPMWHAFRDDWRRIPAERRPRAWFGLGLFLLACILVGVVLILQPWGPHTFLWLLLVGGGAVMVLALAGVTAQAMTDVRRARRRRAGQDQP